MSDIAIRVENLTKKFFLGERVGIKTFREALQDLVTAPFRVWRKNGQGDGQDKVDTEREIWALKGVSFEVKHGEVLGIIGPNGAGKSTLLKILSRITEPTGGYAEIRGRVGSLLEVGTGFHPELTGRENVYLNGAILGMSKAEIRRKFDDIVSFAGVEKFIDTPVKRYSSGMQVRLAFAVAAHLDPEILIIDEVLAVGDAEFQKRCLGKMNEVARSGRTVLFVSHNMAAVEALCDTGILLRSGYLSFSGPIPKAINAYLHSRASVGNVVDLSAYPSRPSSCVPLAETIRVYSATTRLPVLKLGDSLVVEVVVRQKPPSIANTLSIGVLNSHGVRVFTCNSRLQGLSSLPSVGAFTVCCQVDDLRLPPGDYSIDLSLWKSGTLLDALPGCAVFSVVEANVYGTGKIPSAQKGFWIPKSQWSIIRTDLADGLERSL